MSSPCPESKRLCVLPMGPFWIMSFHYVYQKPQMFIDYMQRYDGLQNSINPFANETTIFPSPSKSFTFLLILQYPKLHPPNFFQVYKCQNTHTHTRLKFIHSNFIQNQLRSKLYDLLIYHFKFKFLISRQDLSTPFEMIVVTRFFVLILSIAQEKINHKLSV